MFFSFGVGSVDDPVGAVAVHMMNGIWGTIAVGLLQQAQLQDMQLL